MLGNGSRDLFGTLIAKMGRFEIHPTFKYTCINQNPCASFTSLSCVLKVSDT